MSNTVIAPEGIAHYPFLTRPYTQFDPDGVYKITLEIDKKADDVSDFINKIEEASKDMKQRPYSLDEETGNYMVVFKSKYAPALFDASNQKIGSEVRIGADSTVRVAFTPKAYDGFGGGIKLYLKAVQVITLVEGAAMDASAFGFDELEGGYTIPDDGFSSLIEDDSKPSEKSEELDW